MARGTPECVSRRGHGTLPNRTARSRISSGYFPRRRCSVMAPSSQGSEPAQYPVRLISHRASRGPENRPIGHVHSTPTPLYLCHVHSTLTPLYLCHVHSTLTPVSLPCTSVCADGYTVHSCPPPLSPGDTPGDTRSPLGGPRSRCLRRIARRTLDGAAAHHRPDSAKRPEGLDGRHGVHRQGGLVFVGLRAARAPQRRDHPIRSATLLR